MQSKSDLIAEAAKSAPPVTVAGLTVAGVSLNDLVLIATLFYIVLQAGFLLYRWVRVHNGQVATDD
jgi:hypothetical protein